MMSAFRTHELCLIGCRGNRKASFCKLAIVVHSGKRFGPWVSSFVLGCALNKANVETLVLENKSRIFP